MKRLFLVVTLLGFALNAFAAAVTYTVTVDTSSIKGTAGSLDFNFNPGPFTTQAASLQILNFAGDGSLSGIVSVGENADAFVNAT